MQKSALLGSAAHILVLWDDNNISNNANNLYWLRTGLLLWSFTNQSIIIIKTILNFIKKNKLT